MTRMIRWAASSLVSLVLLWAYFFVPIGGSQRTLWDHTRRIWSTPEAQDLRHDIDRAGHQVATKIRDEVIPTVLATDAGVRPRDGDDAGVISRHP
ncbi:MAG: hypothetical protein U0325_14235 [Polyangiales bacterium]